MIPEGSWQVVLVSVGVPTLLTVAFRYLSARMKVRLDERRSDAEVGAALRDELRDTLDKANRRIADLEEAEAECRRDRDDLHRKLGEANARITRLEERLRDGHSDGNLGRAGSSGGAA